MVGNTLNSLIFHKLFTIKMIIYNYKHFYPTMILVYTQTIISVRNVKNIKYIIKYFQLSKV